MATRIPGKLEVCASLIREHRRMETLLDELSQSLAALKPEDENSIHRLKAVMNRIEPEMNTHFACEEKALFPGVSPYHPMVLMEVEHEELVALRAGLMELLRKKAITREDTDQVRIIGHRFVNDMLDHIGREDTGIFPTCERALSEDEKLTIIEAMDRIRAEAVQIPTPSISRPERSLDVFSVNLDSAGERPVFSERLLDDDGLEIKHLIVKGGSSLAAHWSPKQITLICLKGSGILTANETETELRPGVTIVMTPQLRHGVQARSDCHLLVLLRKRD